MRHAVLGSGKRIRPILCIAAAEVVLRGADDAAALVMPTACALELIHCSSLVCDDLPPFDDAPTRHGQRSCHEVFGEALAILAEHALFARAFELIATQRDDVPNERVTEVISVVSKASGCAGMVGGETVDLQSEGREIDTETLEYICRQKTGALIRASLVSGAFLAGAADSERAALDRYGDHLGLAYQITDDILDETSNPVVMGKPTQADQLKDKATFTQIHGLKGARTLATQQIEAAQRALEPFDESAEPLRLLAEYTLIRHS